MDIPISFTLFLFLRAFHLSHQVQEKKKVRSKSHCSNCNLFTTDKIIPKLQIMLVCTKNNSREPGESLKHASSPLRFSISSVTPAVLSYTFIISIPNQDNISFYGYRKQEISQIAGDLIVSSLLLSLNSVAHCLKKSSKANQQPQALSVCHKSCWIHEAVYQITNMY